MTDENCTFCHWYDWETRSCKHGNIFEGEEEDEEIVIKIKNPKEFCCNHFM